MPRLETPADRARNAPIRARQRRRNASKAARKGGGKPPRSKLAAGAVSGAALGPVRRFLAPITRRAMNAKEAKGIVAPANSPPMSSFEKPGGISGR